MKKADDMAFPQHTDLGSALGLTKREYFAVKALQGILSDESNWYDSETACQSAVELADKLLEELNK